MPAYDVVERHRTFVRAPARITLQAARNQDLLDQWLVRAIFDARALVVGAEVDHTHAPLLPRMQAIGWRVLEEAEGREVVVGAVTRPWERHVVFRPIPPDAFAAFAEPGYVKIVWSLRADAISDQQSIFRTETRAIATDSVARARFRKYWALASPGIALIRRLLLRPVNRAAEREAAVRVAGRVVAGYTETAAR
jgi:hypothetical protein